VIVPLLGSDRIHGLDLLELLSDGFGDRSALDVLGAAPLVKDAATSAPSSKSLGKGRCAKLEAVTLDLSAAYIKAVTEASPDARLIFDRFHVQRLAHDALDTVRRQQWRTADADDKQAFNGTRFALQKNPWNLTDVEQGKLTDVQRTNRPLYRAYLLKETLAKILDGAQVNVARDKLLDWIAWATRSRLPPFRRVARTIKKHIEGIVAYVATGLNSGRKRGPQRQDPYDHQTVVRIPQRLQPHRSHHPLLRRHHALADPQVTLTLPLNREETVLSHAKLPAYAVLFS
jgi:hypothetical protein